MKVTFTPADGDPQVWEFDPDDVDELDAETVEKSYGKNWDSFLVDARSGSARARRFLLWHLQRQTHPSLRLDDLPKYKMGALKVEHSITELRQIRERVEMSDLDADNKEGVLAVLDLEITEAMAQEETSPGKAPDTAASTTSPE